MVKKQTTILDIEGLMSELFLKLKDKNLPKKEKTEAVKKLKYLEQHFRNIQDKHINGKKYPERMAAYHSQTSGLNDKQKKELYKLIDSVPDTMGFNQNYPGTIPETEVLRTQLDLTGVSVGQNRFVYSDKGW